MERFSFPRPLCVPTAEGRQAVPGSCSAFRLLFRLLMFPFGCLLQVVLCYDASKNLLLLGFCGITANAAKRKCSLLGSSSPGWGFPSI